MRLLAIGLMATVLAASLLPSGASAADKAPPPPGQGDAKSHAQAMMEAPQLIQQTAINCTPTDANVTTGKATENGKSTTTKIYELVCQQGLGWMIFSPEGGTPNAFDCMALSTRKPAPGAKDTGAVYCRLPGNADPVKGVQTVAAQAGATCQLSQARWMGSSADNKMDQYELGCADGLASVLQVPRVGASQKLTNVNCMDLKPGDCSYLPKEKYLAQLSSMAQPSGRPCEINDGRYMDCVRASGVSLKCVLTPIEATYAKLSSDVTKSGKSCQVSGARDVGTTAAGDDYVEVACAGGPGLVLTYPQTNDTIKASQTCAAAKATGLACTLSK